MRFFAALLTAFALATHLSAAGAPERRFSKRDALRAIGTFRDDPFSESGRLAAAVVIEFVSTNHSVVVALSRKVVPFLGEKHSGLTKDEATTLFVAFTAGNLDSQLLRNQRKDDPYAGELQVIETYRQMQKRNPKLHCADVERFIDLEKQGQLKKYVTTP
jgi:hypothetical protein